MLDRAGVTGDDGPSHNGMWDLSLLGIVPGMRVAAPRDAATLREELAEARRGRRRADRAPLPEGRGDRVGARACGASTASTSCTRAIAGREPTVLLVCAGRVRRARAWRAGGSGWRSQGISVTVVDPRWVLPVPAGVVAWPREHRLVVTVEDGGRHGGFGSAVTDALRAAECDVPVRDLAIPQEFLEHGSRADCWPPSGWREQDVARRITE